MAPVWSGSENAGKAFGDLLAWFTGTPKPPRRQPAPDVVGMTVADAEYVLAVRDISWKIELWIDPPAPVMGIVVAQSPRAGAWIKRKQVMVLGVEHRWPQPGNGVWQEGAVTDGPTPEQSKSVSPNAGTAPQ